MDERKRGRGDQRNGERASTRAGRSLLAVANTGPIVPPAETDRLLQPFQRLDTDPNGHDEGLALGLSIVHAIATAHGAAVTSRARPHGGLLVEVSFPTAAATT